MNNKWALKRSFQFEVDVDSLDFGVTAGIPISVLLRKENGNTLVQRIVAKLTTDATLLESSEGDVHVERVVAVDPERARLDAVRCRNGAVDITREDRSCEAVCRVVGQPDHLVLVLELDHYGDRPEDLLLHDLHAWLRVREDGRFNKVPFVPITPSTHVHRRSVLLPRFDVVHDTLQESSQELGMKRAAPLTSY